MGVPSVHWPSSSPGGVPHDHLSKSLKALHGGDRRSGRFSEVEPLRANQATGATLNDQEQGIETSAAG